MPRQNPTSAGTSKAMRHDPDGMKRTSLYVTEAAAGALDDAADEVLKALGGNTPRYVALSALLQAGAGQVDQVIRELATKQAAELTERLEALKQNAAPSPTATPSP